MTYVLVHRANLSVNPQALMSDTLTKNETCQVCIINVDRDPWEEDDLCLVQPAPARVNESAPFNINH